MLKYIHFHILFYFFVINLSAQKIIEGKVVYKEKNETLALEGANLYWHGTSLGTVTDQSGNFNISLSDKTNKLIISFLGFKTDTLTVLSEKYIVHFLKEDETTNLNEVSITERKNS